MRIEKYTHLTIVSIHHTVAYARVRRLVEQASADGTLTREENELIWAAIASPETTAEMCALFRSLQEQVWNGELTLDK